MSFVKYIESKDGTLLYTKVQTTEEPETAKATVIIVHGLAEHLGRYDDIAGVLIRSGFNVIRYDQRGHGHSSGENTFYSKVDEITDDLGAIVLYTRKLLPEQQVFVIGHSMGGYTAALYGTKYPGKVEG
ncbi:alpha/beta fold hydrolase [Jeotgalicoccus sp. WY2]|uniref:alpha/beta fold hydrolase n=1 Tax=Jeotgalicoccus sp. WY2 TaxID=2708346 RepID=UPI002021BE63|nr:alpha/beta fold hydrolase [Jeotgalicoccus sp. WY2]